MSASEPTCLHDWRAANWIMIVATATESTVGANHDIMSIATVVLAQTVIIRMNVLNQVYVCKLCTICYNHQGYKDEDYVVISI